MPIWRAVVSITSPVLGGTGSNTWHIRTTDSGVPGQGQADILLGHLEDWYEGMKYYAPSGTSFKWDGNLAGVGADEGEYMATTLWTVAALGSGGSLPPANAICINWRGVSGDRSRRGRTFFGPCAPITLEPDGTIPTTQLGEIRGFAENLVSDSLADGNGALGVWSRQELVLRDFAATSVRDQFAVLTSRRD